MSSKSISARIGAGVLSTVFLASGAAGAATKYGISFTHDGKREDGKPVTIDKVVLSFRPYDSSHLKTFHPSQLGCFTGFYGPETVYAPLPSYDELTGVWSDQNNASYDAYAPAANVKPALSSIRTSKTLPALQFNGMPNGVKAVNVLEARHAPVNQGQGYTAFALIQTASTENTTPNVILSSGNFPHTVSIMQSEERPNEIYTRSLGKNGKAFPFDTKGEPALIVERGTVSGTTSSVETFGNMQPFFKGSGTYAPAGNGSLVIGGQPGSSSLTFNGLIGRVAFCNKPLTDPETLMVWSWMARNSGMEPSTVIQEIWNPQVVALLDPAFVSQCNSDPSGRCVALTPEQNSILCKYNKTEVELDPTNPAFIQICSSVTLPFNMAGQDWKGKIFGVAVEGALKSTASETFRLDTASGPTL